MVVPRAGRHSLFANTYERPLDLDHLPAAVARVARIAWNGHGPTGHSDPMPPVSTSTSPVAPFAPHDPVFADVLGAPARRVGHRHGRARRAGRRRGVDSPVADSSRRGRAPLRGRFAHERPDTRLPDCPTARLPDCPTARTLVFGSIRRPNPQPENSRSAGFGTANRVVTGASGDTHLAQVGVDLSHVGGASSTL